VPDAGAPAEVDLSERGESSQRAQVGELLHHVDSRTNIKRSRDEFNRNLLLFTERQSGQQARFFCRSAMRESATSIYAI